MTSGSQGSILGSIRALWNAGSVGGMTDGQLLDQFLSRRDEGAEAAFVALVALHGPMVWDVCRSVLSDPHAAEDAFQATFLILVRKAGSIRRRDAVGPWLYDVARRVAVRAKAAATRRPLREGQGRALPVVEEFIRNDPNDPRGAELLDQVARQSRDPKVKVKVLRRLLAEYPDAPASRWAAGSVRLLEGVGRPFELAFTDAIKGTPMSVQALKGKVVIIDFWATWCQPCVADMPKLKNLYAKYRDQGVEFIGVSLDLPKEKGGLDKLEAFVARNGITWPQYYQGKGWESEFSRSWGINSIPHILLIDAEGNLAVTDTRVDALVAIPGALGELEQRIIAYLAKAQKAAPKN